MNRNEFTQRIALGTHVHEAAWLLDTHAGQLLLAEAYHSGRRPRCMCVVSGIDMYVARRGDVYYLARMPGSGILHDSTCPSVEDVNLFSGASGYASGVIRDDMQGGTIINYRADTARQIGNTTASIDGLLDLLIETAGLNAWSPLDEPKTWASVATHLTRAAATISIAGDEPFSRRLLLPAPFNKDLSAEQQRSHESFLSALDTCFVCAPLRAVKPTSFGWQLVLKHMPSILFWLPRRLGNAMEDSSFGAIQFNRFDHPAICLVQIRRTKGEGYSVEHMALRRTDRRFLPVLSGDEENATEELARRMIPHLRPLRFDLPWDAPLADFALMGPPVPTPLFVLSPTGCLPLDDAKRATWRLLKDTIVRPVSFEGRQFSPPLPPLET